jgi:hypothetical protein
MHGGATPGGLASARFRHGRYSRYIPRSLAAEWERAAADPELTSLRSELGLLTIRVGELLSELEGSPPWAELLSTWHRVRAAPDGEARQSAMAEMEVLFTSGQAAAERHEAVWAQIRALVQERARLAQAESRREVEAGLMMSKQQALTLAHRLFLEVRAVVLDPAVFGAGPQAVLSALQRRLSAVMGRPEAEGAEVLDGQATAHTAGGGAGG